MVCDIQDPLAIQPAEWLLSNIQHPESSIGLSFVNL